MITRRGSTGSYWDYRQFWLVFVAHRHGQHPDIVRILPSSSEFQVGSFIYIYIYRTISTRPQLVFYVHGVCPPMLNVLWCSNFLCTIDRRISSCQCVASHTGLRPVPKTSRRLIMWFSNISRTGCVRVCRCVCIDGTPMVQHLGYSTHSLDLSPLIIILCNDSSFRRYTTQKFLRPGN